ncbi:MAG: SAM-dependent methyltransferase, partial [Candidatus Binatia bacterium]
MTVFLSVHRLLVALLLALIFASSGAWAQSGKSEYQPHVGQEGKDVIWVPTPQALVEKMLDMAKVTAK